MAMLLVIERVEFPDILEGKYSGFYWPGNRPDINTKEKAWFILKRKVGQVLPKGPDDLSLARESVTTPEDCKS